MHTMKVKTLKERLSVFSKLNVKNTLPILESVYFITGQGVKMTNFETSILRKFDYTGPTVIVDNFKRLYAVISKIKATNVEITLENDLAVFIFDDNDRVEFPTHPLDEYPINISTTWEFKEDISMTDIKKSKALLPLLSKDELRPALGYMVYSNAIIATDASMMAFIPRNTTLNTFCYPLKTTYHMFNKEVLNVLLSSTEAINEIAVAASVNNNLDKDTEYCLRSDLAKRLKDNDIVVDDKTFNKNVSLDKYGKIVAGETEIIFREFDGVFPNYLSVIPKDNGLSLTVDKAKLINILEIMANVNNLKVVFSWTKEICNITVSDLNLETSRTSSIPILHYRLNENATDFNKIGFNPVKLITILNAIDNGVITMSMRDDSRAVIINTNYLIMPIMLSDC